MNGYEYILSKQTAWATNSGITLVGSKGKRGRPAYTSKLDQNLFQQLLPDVQKSFAAGDGGELGSTEFPGKMQAVHSSSALGVNIFQYWKSINAVPVIAAQCGLCRVGSQVSTDIYFECGTRGRSSYLHILAWKTYLTMLFVTYAKTIKNRCPGGLTSQEFALLLGCERVGREYGFYSQET